MLLTGQRVPKQAHGNTNMHKLTTRDMVGHTGDASPCLLHTYTHTYNAHRGQTQGSNLSSGYTPLKTVVDVHVTMQTDIVLLLQNNALH